MTDVYWYDRVRSNGQLYRVYHQGLVYVHLCRDGGGGEWPACLSVCLPASQTGWTCVPTVCPGSLQYLAVAFLLGWPWARMA